MATWCARVWSPNPRCALHGSHDGAAADTTAAIVAAAVYALCAQDVVKALGEFKVALGLRRLRMAQAVQHVNERKDAAAEIACGLGLLLLARLVTLQ